MAHRFLFFKKENCYGLKASMYNIVRTYIVNHTSVVQLRRLAITLINRHECDLLNTSGGLGHASLPKLVERLREIIGGRRVRREKCAVCASESRVCHLYL